jgi:hypothetical protein
MSGPDMRFDAVGGNGIALQVGGWDEPIGSDCCWLVIVSDMPPRKKVMEGMVSPVVSAHRHTGAGRHASKPLGIRLPLRLRLHSRRRLARVPRTMSLPSHSAALVCILGKGTGVVGRFSCPSCNLKVTCQPSCWRFNMSWRRQACDEGDAGQSASRVRSWIDTTFGCRRISTRLGQGSCDV